jgi:hypothetical protein
MESKNHEQGYRDGETDARICGLEKRSDKMDDALANIYGRLNTIDKKLSSIGWTGRLIEVAVVAGVAAAISKLV